MARMVGFNRSEKVDKIIQSISVNYSSIGYNQSFKSGAENEKHSQDLVVLWLITGSGYHRDAGYGASDGRGRIAVGKNVVLF